jgi:5'-nucleotidase
MRHQILFVTAALLMGCNTTPTRTLVLLHTNDEHSHLLGFQPEADDFPTPSLNGGIEGGIARRATLLAQERARVAALGKNAASLTVSAGDNMMGTLMQAATTETAPDFVLMKQLGYDVTTWGNHELDFGPKGLAQATTVAEANGGITTTVASNVHFSASDPADDDLAALFDESGHDASKPVHRYWVVTAANGLKVGFVGVLGADAARFAPLKAPLTFSLPPSGDETDSAGVIAAVAADLQPVVDTLRNVEKVDVVVALSHSGVDPADPTLGEDYQLAQNVSGLDVIVSGHTHTHTAAFTVNNKATGKPVVIQEAGAYGDTLGRITLTVDGKGVHWDQADTALLDVNDSIAADPAVTMKLADEVGSLESIKLAGGASFLEAALRNITGMPITDDPATAGDLYFYPLAKLTFDLPGESVRKETPLLLLSADAQLAAAEQYGGATQIALQVSGVIRGDLPQGKIGVLGFGDVFRVLPLGVSTVDGSIGYPLVRVSLPLAAVKAALEASASLSYGSLDLSSYFIVLAGARYEFDTSRPAFSTSKSTVDPNNGRVTKITLATDHTKPDVFDHVAFDLAQGGYLDSPLQPIVVVTNEYVAEFAASFGIPLNTPDGGAAYKDPGEAILHRPDLTEVKDYEALAAFIRTQAAANGGTLPSRYDPAVATFPSRTLCSGPLCSP